MKQKIFQAVVTFFRSFPVLSFISWKFEKASVRVSVLKWEIEDIPEVRERKYLFTPSSELRRKSATAADLLFLSDKYFQFFPSRAEENGRKRKPEVLSASGSLVYAPRELEEGGSSWGLFNLSRTDWNQIFWLPSWSRSGREGLRTIGSTRTLNINSFLSPRIETPNELTPSLAEDLWEWLTL